MLDQDELAKIASDVKILNDNLQMGAGGSVDLWDSNGELCGHIAWSSNNGAWFYYAVGEKVT
jgi:hypothetical protein